MFWRLFRHPRRNDAPRDTSPPSSRPSSPPSEETLHEKALEVIARTDEIVDTARKNARAQAKLALKVEELDRKLLAGFADLRAALSETANANGKDPATTGSVRTWGELFDALDLLDVATASVSAGDVDGVAEGLRGVSAKLVQLLERQSLSRVAHEAVAGQKPDGRSFRVVGTEEHADLPDGVVVRTVRAAIVTGNAVLREGEVLTNRKVE